MAKTYGTVGGTPKYFLQFSDKLNYEQNVSNIERGFSDDAYDSIKPYIDNYMGKVFEEICISFLWKMKSAKKVLFIDIGRWWGTNSKIRKEVEIDIMGTIDKESALFCECKWHNELVSLPVYQSLVDKASMFNYKNKEYYIFANKGFTEELKNEERRYKNLHLITYKEMFLN